MLKVYRTNRRKKIVKSKFGRLWNGNNALIGKVFNYFVIRYDGLYWYAISGHKDRKFVLEAMHYNDKVKVDDSTDFIAVSPYSKSHAWLAMKLDVVPGKLDFDSMTLDELKEVDYILTTTINNYE